MKLTLQLAVEMAPLPQVLVIVYTVKLKFCTNKCRTWYTQLILLFLVYYCVLQEFIPLDIAVFLGQGFNWWKL